MQQILAAIARFYSAAGRTSIPRMVLVSAAAYGVLWLCGYASWTQGQLAALGFGALAGAAIAKFVVEAVRRLRDAGIDRRRAAWVALGFGAWLFAYFWIFMAIDPAWADWLFDVLCWTVSAVLAIALLWPPRGGPVIASEHGVRRGGQFALACITGGALMAGFIAWLEIGMDAANRRAMAQTEAMERENRTSPPD